jgi:hypothetical protein
MAEGKPTAEQIANLEQLMGKDAVNNVKAEVEKWRHGDHVGATGEFLKGSLHVGEHLLMHPVDTAQGLVAITTDHIEGPAAKPKPTNGRPVVPGR